MTKSRRAIRIALLLALALSLAGNAYLIQASDGYYRATNVVRLDPAGMKVYAAERPKALPVGRPVLVLFGDSRALMWSQPAVADQYQVVNRGIGNQTTAQVLLRIDADLVPLHPAVVALEVGVNDLKAIADLPERRGEIVADCEANVRRIVERCRGTGATVVLVSVFAIGDVPMWRRPFWSDDVNASVREVNQFLPTLAGDGVVLFDADPVLDDERGKIKPSYQLDFLHLAPAGYEALNGKLVPLVRGLGR